jgi:hypothetical protein
VYTWKELDGFKRFQTFLKKREERERERKMIWTQKEAIRLRSVQWLASQFHKLCGHQLGKHWFKHFEAWLWSSREHDDVEDAILSDDKDAYVFSLSLSAHSHTYLHTYLHTDVTISISETNYSRVRNRHIVWRPFVSS